jgi:mRNA interferase RelE/StbE
LFKRNKGNNPKIEKGERGKENVWKMLEYSKKAVKYINSTDKSTKKRLQEAIEKIPFGDIKKLQGINNGYRLRVGDLRVLFTMEDDKIYIDNIIPRGQAYKRL